MTRHVLEDAHALSERARRFLAPQVLSAIPTNQNHAWYVCTDLEDRRVPGPAGGLDRLEQFFARFGGLAFATERLATGTGYQFDRSGTCGWTQVESGDWVAEIGDIDGWPLTLSCSTGRIGIDVLHPETWIAASATNLIESAALGQEVRGAKSWLEAVPVTGRGPGWGLNLEADRLFGLVPEVREASSVWNRWFVDEHVAVHAWREAYNEERREVVMAWYRSPEGLHRIEAVVGPLRTV